MINTASTTAGQLVQFSDSNKTNATPVTVGIGLTNNAGTLSNNIVAGYGVGLTGGANGQITLATSGNVIAHGLGNYAMSTTDQFVINSSSGTTITLPTNTGTVGNTYTVKNGFTSGLNTVDTVGGASTIDGGLTYTLTNSWSSATFLNTGSAWSIIAIVP
jgi:hypothetical protein